MSKHESIIQTFEDGRVRYHLDFWREGVLDGLKTARDAVDKLEIDTKTKIKIKLFIIAHEKQIEAIQNYERNRTGKGVPPEVWSSGKG